MDLMKMSRDDLSTVRAGLEVVAKAADLLAKGGLDPVISLSDGETVLRAGAILGSLRGEPELVEPIEIVGSPTTPVVEGTVGVAKVVEATSAQVAAEPLHATVSISAPLRWKWPSSARRTTRLSMNCAGRSACRWATSAHPSMSRLSR